MNQSTAAQVAQALELAIVKAHRALEKAREFRAQNGLAEGDAIALLEERMPAEDVAQVREQIQRETECIQQDVKMQNASLNTMVRKNSHRLHQML